MVIALHVTLTGTLNPISGARCSSFTAISARNLGGGGGGVVRVSLQMR